MKKRAYELKNVMLLICEAHQCLSLCKSELFDFKSKVLWYHVITQVCVECFEAETSDKTSKNKDPTNPLTSHLKPFSKQRANQNNQLMS